MEKLQTFAQRASQWVGSVPSIIFHTVVFIVSFVLPILGIVSIGTVLLAVTTIVSLEAIYLQIFIQMTMNKHDADINVIHKHLGIDREK